MHQLECASCRFPIWQQVNRVIQPKRFLPLLPRITTGSKCLIVQPSALLDLLLKNTPLPVRQPDTVLVCGFVRFAHILIAAQNHIEHKCCIYPFLCIPMLLVCGARLECLEAHRVTHAMHPYAERQRFSGALFDKHGLPVDHWQKGHTKCGSHPDRYNRSQ